jgi:hypothetical protein
MDGVGRGFPPGDLRASDTDRDRALSELSEAFRVGRITADEFDQRSGLALRARTGKELVALLADLPLVNLPAPRASPPRSASRIVAVMAAALAAAAGLGALAVQNALHPAIVHETRGVWNARLLPATLPPLTPVIPAPPQSSGVHIVARPVFDWAGIVTPAAIAVLLVMLIVILDVTRVNRARPVS